MDTGTQRTRSLAALMRERQLLLADPGGNTARLIGHCIERTRRAAVQRRPRDRRWTLCVPWALCTLHRWRYNDRRIPGCSEKLFRNRRLLTVSYAVDSHSECSAWSYTVWHHYIADRLVDAIRSHARRGRKLKRSAGPSLSQPSCEIRQDIYSDFERFQVACTP